MEQDICETNASTAVLTSWGYQCVNAFAAGLIIKVCSCTFTSCSGPHGALNGWIGMDSYPGTTLRGVSGSESRWFTSGSKFRKLCECLLVDHLVLVSAPRWWMSNPLVSPMGGDAAV